ncbi:MAG: ASCH domain-containing protein [Firmicutes bacterium]|nr:ASCH domain-containing protein [[Eubacterium] siraeum]MCM1487176.1 ASCH domain-containing protein [Bacillota bacterium]
MTAEEMWAAFVQENGIRDNKYEAWAYGDDPDKLAELTINGTKTATSSAYYWYETEGEELPKEEEYSVILNSKNDAVCVVKTSKVYVERFNKVSEEHAYKEGEGDRSLEYWRKIHKAFFTEELAEAGEAFDENMKVVCEEFEVVYKP